METNFNKKETIRLLEEYYEKLEGRKVKVTISAKVTTVGIYESKGCRTTITGSEEMDVAGIKKQVKFPISEEDLSHNLTAILGENGFDVQSVSLDDGISSHIEGFYMGEHTVDRAYCNGVTVRLEKKHNKQYIR